MRVALIALAGAAGALARYALGLLAGPQAFPWATMGINAVGSLLLGALLAGSAKLPEPATTALAVGLLGAFTTFSTFSTEALVLLREGRLLAAAAYIAASVILGVAAAAVGYYAVGATVR